MRAALGKLRLRARKRALAFDVSPTPQKHSGNKFRDGFLWQVQVFLNGHKILTKLTTIRCLDFTIASKQNWEISLKAQKWRCPSSFWKNYSSALFDLENSGSNSSLLIKVHDF